MHMRKELLALHRFRRRVNMSSLVWRTYSRNDLRKLGKHSQQNSPSQNFGGMYNNEAFNPKVLD